MSPQVRRRRWPNGQRGRECGGAGSQTLSSMLGSPQVHQGGYRPPLCVVLAEEGSDPTGMRKDKRLSPGMVRTCLLPPCPRLLQRQVR